MNNTNTNKLIITKNEYSDIQIDNRIIPLFSSPLYLKEKSLKKRNKYNFTLLNPQKKLTYKVISFREILSLFLKGFNIYNFNLNKYLLQHKKLDLIEEVIYNKSNNTNEEYYNLNIRLNKYMFILNKYLPVLRYRSFLYNVLLFFPKQLLKPQAHISFSYRLRNLHKLLLLKKVDLKKNILFDLSEFNIISKYIYKKYPLYLENKLPENKELLIKSLELKLKKGEVKAQRRLIKKILDKGNILLEDLNLLIIKKQNLIQNLENSKKIEPINYLSKKTVVENNKDTNIQNNSNIPSLGKDILINPVQGLSSNPVSLYYYSNKNNINNLDKETLRVEESKPILNQYLKEMSIYNMRSKGIFIYYSNLIGFNFNRENNKLYKNIYKLLAASFKSMYCLISKPVFIITPDKIIIQLFYYLFIPNILKLKKIYKYNNSNKKNFRELLNRKKKIKKQYSKFRKIKLKVRIKLRKLSNITLTKIFSNKFKDLCLILNKFFKKPVELDLIRLHYPYNDSNILVNLLGIMINKIKLRIIIRRLFEKAVIKNLNKLSGNKVNIIPAFLSGITIRVAGRLLTHRVVPRQTVKTTRRGASAKGKINFKDVATYTNKNKRGAFSITVKSGQNFF